MNAFLSHNLTPQPVEMKRLAVANRSYVNFLTKRMEPTKFRFFEAVKMRPHVSRHPGGLPPHNPCRSASRTLFDCGAPHTEACHIEPRWWQGALIGNGPLITFCLAHRKFPFLLWSCSGKPPINFLSEAFFPLKQPIEIAKPD